MEPMDEHATIAAGEMVEVYAEIHNVCCEAHRSEHGKYRTHVVCSWNLRKSSGESVWDGPKQFDRPDDTMTPPHDHFQHLSFAMPRVSSGTYVLELEVLDVPTGRKARQRLEFAVGPPLEAVSGE
jgi:hypothetical protein